MTRRGDRSRRIVRALADVATRGVHVLERGHRALDLAAALGKRAADELSAVDRTAEQLADLAKRFRGPQ